MRASIRLCWLETEARGMLGIRNAYSPYCIVAQDYSTVVEEGAVVVLQCL